MEENREDRIDIIPFETEGAEITLGDFRAATGVKRTTINSCATFTAALMVEFILIWTPCQVLLTGGTLRHKWVDLTGPMTLKNIDEFYVDVLITGCDAALADEGFFTSDINLAELERKAVEKSNQVIVVTESSKFGKKDFAKFASIDEVDMVITDGGLSVSSKKQLLNRNLDVMVL